MMATPLISDLVREGRATPKDGAYLMELREDLRSRREQRIHIGPFARIALTLGTVILALLGIRRSE